MGLERSDEARREDSLQQALGSAERMNIQRADKITELERIIVEAKECVRITQEENDKLKSKAEGLQVNRDYLFKENERYRQAFLKHNKLMNDTKEQIKTLLAQIDKLRSRNIEALEQVWNSLKAVKIYFC